VTGVWLASYLTLWGLVIVMGLLLVGVLHQLGVLHLQIEQLRTAPEVTPPTPEDDGPAIGSPLPDLVAESVNGFGAIAPATLRNQRGALLVFMSPMCELCQQVVEPLNALVEDASQGVRPIVIMRADEQGCRAFLSVFPLRMPTLCDNDRTITMGFKVHRTPFGLLYDEQGTLVRKGLVEGEADLAALLGDGSAPLAAQAHVFPRPALSEVHT
jgi:methylamine dehydrogenase accessory protein MauD